MTEGRHALVRLDRSDAGRRSDRRGRHRRRGCAEPRISIGGHQGSCVRRCRTCYRRRCFLFDGLGRTCRSARGLCAGHRLQEILQALKTGPNSKMAVSYFEWSASSDQKIIIPWRVIDGPESADAVAAEIMKTPVRRGSRTSISGAINFAMPLFEENPYRGLRRVIDISGDGPNNNGAPVTGARDAALEKGITINGLPIMVKEPSYSSMDIDNLDLYYEDCVIGGPGSFVVSIKDRDKFKEAIRTKLLLEVAGRTPEPRIVPVAEKEPRVPCLIGEKIWQDRWGR